MESLQETQFLFALHIGIWFDVEILNIEHGRVVMVDSFGWFTSDPSGSSGFLPQFGLIKLG